MKTTIEKGKFIVLAGCEGSGKTTQIEMLKKKYPNALFTREPGGTEYAEFVRSIVLKSEFSSDLNGYEQMTQVFSGRSHHLRKVILPALESGKDVFCDRYDCCSFAYQIFGMQSTKLFGLFDSLQLAMETLTFPNLYLILDISPEEGMKRVSKRESEKGEINYFDKRGLDFHIRVREGYKRFAQKHTNRVVLIDAHPSKDEVAKSIDEALKTALK